MIEGYRIGKSKLRIDIVEPPTESRFDELKEAAANEAQSTKGRLCYTGLGPTKVGVSNEEVLESKAVAEVKLPCRQDACTRKLIIDKTGKHAVISCNGYKIGQHTEQFYESGYGNSPLPAGNNEITIDDFAECMAPEETLEIATRVAKSAGFVTEEIVIDKN